MTFNEFIKNIALANKLIHVHTAYKTAMTYSRPMLLHKHMQLTLLLICFTDSLVQLLT